MLGLETALALALTELDLPIERVLALMSWQPAAIVGLDATPMVGRSRKVRRRTSSSSIPRRTGSSIRSGLASRSRNTPYAGRSLTGRVRHTILWGEPVVIDGEAQR